MDDECRFINGNNGECLTHAKHQAILCTHAAAALQGRVDYLVQGLESMRDKIGGPDCGCPIYARKVLDCYRGLATSKETREAYKGLAGERILELEARIRELEAMWAAKSEVGDARIARAEQTVGRLRKALVQRTKCATCHTGDRPVLDNGRYIHLYGDGSFLGPCFDLVALAALSPQEPPNAA